MKEPSPKRKPASFAKNAVRVADHGAVDVRHADAGRAVEDREVVLLTELEDVAGGLLDVDAPVEDGGLGGLRVLGVIGLVDGEAAAADDGLRVAERGVRARCVHRTGEQGQQRDLRDDAHREAMASHVCVRREVPGGASASSVFHLTSPLHERCRHGLASVHHAEQEVQLALGADVALLRSHARFGESLCDQSGSLFSSGAWLELLERSFLSAKLFTPAMRARDSRCPFFVVGRSGLAIWAFRLVGASAALPRHRALSKH